MNNQILNELKTYPNQAIIWEIINYGRTGKVVNLSGNSILIIENCDEPYGVIIGKLLINNFKELLNILKNYKDPMIYCDSLYHPLFLKNGYDFHLRVELTLGKLKQQDHEFENMRLIFIDDIAQAKIYKLEKNFVKYNYGYALIRDGGIAVSEAYVVIGDKWGELNIFTHEDYRRKNYAKIVLSHLIKHCINKNITPTYSCQVDNKASLHTAVSLGFYVKRYYTLMVPEWGNILCPNLANWIRQNKYP